MSEFTTKQACAERLKKAIAQFELNNLHYAGSWAADVLDDEILLVWSCEEEDPRVQAMGTEVPKGFERLGADSPWVLWGGNTIIEAAQIGDFDDSGADGYTDKYGDSMVTQYVSWKF